jgi:hypothetical protein
MDAFPGTSYLATFVLSLRDKVRVSFAPFASLADVAKGGDGAKSALREILVCACGKSLPIFFSIPRLSSQRQTCYMIRRIR